MSPVLAVAVLSGLAVSAEAPNDALLLAKFQTLCVATRANADAAVAKADAAGWKKPAAYNAGIHGGKLAREADDGHGHWELTVGMGSQLRGVPVSMNGCGVRLVGRPVVAMADTVQAWLGVGPVRSEGLTKLYAFTRHDSTNSAINDKASLDKAVQDGSLQLLVIDLRDDGTELDFAVPVTQPK